MSQATRHPGNEQRQRLSIKQWQFNMHRGGLGRSRRRLDRVGSKIEVPVRPFSTIEVRGSESTYLAVPPHGALCRPLVDYFPGCTIDEWFSHEEQWRKKRMRWRWGEYCMMTGGRPAEVHEIDAKGHGGKSCALVPWNMITVSSYCHRMLQSHTWTVIRYDPLAWPLDRTGIQIIDEEGKLISCWFNLSPYEREKRKQYI